MNLFAGLCEKVGADIEAIKEGIGSDPRIGNKYLKAGIGFGGSCLPKDIQALCAIAKEQEYPSEFFEMILDINQAQIKRFFHKVLSYFEMPDGKTLAIWGLSFKPLTDDLRQAPSLDFIQMALEHGFQLRLFDPVSMDKALALFCDCETIIFCSDEEETASGADAVIILTEWPQFHTIDLEKIGLLMNNKAIFDGRGIFDEEEISELGFDYFRLGKKGMGHGNTRPVLGKNS